MFTSQQHTMSNPKKWMSSKVRKGSKSGSGSSENIPIVNNGNKETPPSPPTRISAGSVSHGSADMTFEFRPGSLQSRGSISHFLHGMENVVDSSSSIDTLSTGLTPSPSTTPPKKTWEKNYKSFLKKSKVVPPIGIGHDALLSGNPPLPAFRHAPRPKSAINNATKYVQPIPNGNHDEDLGPSLADGFQEHCSITAPPSPSASSKDSSHKGGNIFKRLRSKTKSHDCLDSTLRRGVDRKSPSNTPPGSHESTPRRTAECVTQQVSEDKASALQAHLSTPQLDSSASSNTHRRSDPSAIVQSHNNLYNSDSLDKPRHRGHSTSLDVSKSMFSRVQSMGCNLAIREGEPALTPTEEEELLRERKKAFTDFHNMGVDSTSAFLGGEDSSVHQRNVFLTSMAYPAGSAGGKGESNCVPHHSIFDF